MVGPGKGRRVIWGNFDDVGMASMHVAISFVAINAPQLRSWMVREDLESHRCLYSTYSDITVMLGELDLVKEGPSASACAAVSLAVVWGQKKLASPLLAITGTIDLRDRIGIIGGMMGKMSVARNVPREMIVVPSDNLKELEEKGYPDWPDDLVVYAKERLHGVSNYIELLELTLQGEHDGR